MRLPFQIGSSVSAPNSPQGKATTAASSLHPGAPRHTPKVRPFRKCASTCSSPSSKHTRELSQISENSTFTQIGVRNWAKSASGARLKYLLSRGKSGPIQTQEPETDWNLFLGYIGSPKAPTEVWLRDTSTSPRVDLPPAVIPPKGQCFKLAKIPYSESKDSLQRARLYLKLREDGCSKAKSIFYSKKRRCMFDSTQTKDGPHCHRTIRLGDNRALGPNWNGWQMHSPMIEVERRFQPINLDPDLREYDAISKEYERLTHRQAKMRDQLGFFEADEDREKYFRGLTREWEKREQKEQQKTVGSQSKSQLNTVITEEKTVLPTTSEEQRPTDNESRRSKAAAFAFLFPAVKVIPPTQETEAGADQSKASSEMVGSVIDPAKVDLFDNGSLVIRSVAPVRESAPIVVRKAGRRPTQEFKKHLLEPPSITLIRRRTFSAYSDLITKMRSMSKKDALSTAQIAKSQLMLGLAKMCEEVNKGRKISVSEENRLLLPRKSKTFLDIKMFSKRSADKE